MKQIKFKKLYIKNFRNINELEIDFKDNVTEIIGENGLGKTNTLNAITWCLFGKNIDDNKQFVISPIIDGVEDNSINTIVKIVLTTDYVIERSYQNRVTNLKTGWVIDGIENLVAITQTKYAQELIENVVDENIFKSLSNINYIPNLHWKDLKELIFDLIGDVRDEEVLLKDDFTLIEDYVTKFGIEQTQKLLQETDKELNEDIKRLETEYQTLLNTKEKYVAEENETEILKLRKKEIEDILYASENSQRLIQAQISEYWQEDKNIKQIEEKIKSLKEQIESTIENISEYDILYSKYASKIEDLRNEDIKKIELELWQYKRTKESEIECVAEHKKKSEEFAKAGNELKQKEIKVEKNTCSMCNQTLPQEIIDKTLENLKKKQIEDLEKIKNDYDTEKEIIKQHEKTIEELDLKIKNCESKIENIKIKDYAITENAEQIAIKEAKAKKEKQLEDMKDSLNDYAVVLEINLERFSKMELPSVNIEDNTPLRLELDEINEKLATTITLSKISEDVEKALSNLNTKKDNKSLNKDKMQQVIKFNNIKADILQEKVKKHFNLCNFRTKETTLSGEEVECFKIVTKDNVEYKETNTANKILMGIDLIEGIQKLKETYLPILIDGVEVITKDLESENTQLIITKAVKNKTKLEVK